MNRESGKEVFRLRADLASAKIGKHQIKLGSFNVAVAEFYENTTSAREDIESILTESTALSAALEEAGKALEACIRQLSDHDLTKHVAQVALAKLAPFREVE